MSISPLQVQLDAVFTYLHLARRQTQYYERGRRKRNNREKDKQMAFIMTQLKMSFLLLAPQKDIQFCVYVCVRSTPGDVSVSSLSSKRTGWSHFFTLSKAKPVTLHHSRQISQTDTHVFHHKNNLEDYRIRITDLFMEKMHWTFTLQSDLLE